MQKCVGLFSCFPERSVKSVRLYEENAAATQLGWKEAGSVWLSREGPAQPLRLQPQIWVSWFQAPYDLSGPNNPLARCGERLLILFLRKWDWASGRLSAFLIPQIWMVSDCPAMASMASMASMAFCVAGGSLESLCSFFDNLIHLYFLCP